MHMREKEKSISQQFDLWHFCKSIRKKLIAAAKKNATRSLMIGSDQFATISGGVVQLVTNMRPS